MESGCSPISAKAEGMAFELVRIRDDEKHHSIIWHTYRNLTHRGLVHDDVRSSGTSTGDGEKGGLSSSAGEGLCISTRFV